MPGHATLLYTSLKIVGAIAEASWITLFGRCLPQKHKLHTRKAFEHLRGDIEALWNCRILSRIRRLVVPFARLDCNHLIIDTDIYSRDDVSVASLGEFDRLTCTKEVVFVDRSNQNDFCCAWFGIFRTKVPIQVPHHPRRDSSQLGLPQQRLRCNAYFPFHGTLLNNNMIEDRRLINWSPVRDKRAEPLSKNRCARPRLGYCRNGCRRVCSA